MNSIFNYTYQALQQKLLLLKINTFHAKVIYKFIYQQNGLAWEKCHSLSINHQEIITNNFAINLLEIIETNVNIKEETTKYLLRLSDGNYIESVAMKFNYGYSICLSTQVGCNMGCKFCASGQQKKIRNLTVEEIILQYMTIIHHLKKTINNLVFMGIGEPFDNYNHVCQSIKIFTNHYGLGIGESHITVSTCGIVDKIIKFAKQFSKINLAISLHATNDVIRNQLMPINHKWNLKSLFKAINKYFLFTNNKQITIEYILLKNINDDKNSFTQLIDLVKNKPFLINIIRYNKVNNTAYSRSKNINKLVHLLKEQNIKTTIRLERGKQINAACGQLRINKKNKIFK